jgi:hypothetical protein
MQIMLNSRATYFDNVVFVVDKIRVNKEEMATMASLAAFYDNTKVLMNC